MTIKSKTLIALIMVFILTIGIFAGVLVKEGEEKALATPANE